MSGVKERHSIKTLQLMSFVYSFSRPENTKLKKQIKHGLERGFTKVSNKY